MLETAENIEAQIRNVYARCLLRFLRGRRLENNPLTIHELKNTWTFARSTEAEKAALRFAVEHTPRHSALPTAYDSGMVRQRDEYLGWFSANASDAVLNQHRNWADELNRIRFDVRRELGVDNLGADFAWIWEKRN
jgi:hypothetical protein